MEVYKLVANIVEGRRRGILLLGGPGKSTISKYLILMDKDFYLVGDDYCDIISLNIRRLVETREVIPDPMLDQVIISHVTDEVQEILGTANPREPTGKVRNDIGFEDQDIFEKKFRIGRKKPLDKLRRKSYYIDTIAQRVAHKFWTKIDYVCFFTGWGKLNPYELRDYIEIHYPDISKEKRSEIGLYLWDKFHLPNTTNEVKKDTYFLESDPEKKSWLLDLCRNMDNRGHDWTEFLKNTNIPFYIFFYYTDPYYKAMDITSIIVDELPIIDPQQQHLWEQEELKKRYPEEYESEEEE